MNDYVGKKKRGKWEYFKAARKRIGKKKILQNCGTETCRLKPKCLIMGSALLKSAFPVAVMVVVHMKLLKIFQLHVFNPEEILRRMARNFYKFKIYKIKMLVYVPWILSESS